MSSALARRVLLVDDDDRLVRMMRLTLVTEDFDVETANDGLAALDKLEGPAFDVIVLDLQMPKMDGRACYRALRQRGTQTPVIIVSAYDAEAGRAELGANRSISKPFDPRVLVRAIQNLTAPSGAGGATPGVSLDAAE